jgi:hypothetical protein
MYKKKTGSGGLQTPSAGTSVTTPHLTVQQIIDSYKDVSVSLDPETGESVLDTLFSASKRDILEEAARYDTWQ